MPPACVGDVHYLSTLRRYANDSRIAWLDFLVPVNFFFICHRILTTPLLCSGPGLAAPPGGVLHMIYYNTYMQYNAIPQSCLREFQSVRVCLTHPPRTDSILRSHTETCAAGFS